jgi:hypothetical protein
MQYMANARAHRALRALSQIGATALLVSIITPAAQGATLGATEDAYTRADRASSNYGSSNVLMTKRWQNMRTFVKFDIGSVSSVDSATLRIPVGDVKGAGTITVHRVLESWDERSINHGNQPGSGSALASFSISDSDSGKTITLDATGLARDLVANRSQNFGIVLKTSNAAVHLKSRESGTPIQLVVNGTSGGDGGGSNQPPSISGNPPTAVNAGSTYDFRPTISDPDGDQMSCSITNKPAWASFSGSSCRLYGTPVERDIGIHGQISITVSDGQATSKLGPFEIEVSAPGNGGVTLTWVIPTENTDGSPLLDLDGFRIHWERRNSTAKGTIGVNNGSVSTYVVENLSPGTYDFTVAAVNSKGVSSGLSNSVRRTVE